MPLCYLLCRTVFRHQSARVISQSNIYFSGDPQKFVVKSLCTKASGRSLQAQYNKIVVPGLRAGSINDSYLRISSCRSASSNQAQTSSDIEVYYGNLTSQIRAVKFFSLLTSVTGLAAQPLLIQKASELGNLGAGIAVGSFVGFFTFITPFLLHWLTKKYVTRLHYNPETHKYTATTLSLLLLEKKTTFSASEVTVPEVAGMFTSFTVNNGNTSLFVDPRLFSHPEHYARIMGYDKPLDFKMEHSASEEPNPKP